MWSHGQKSKTAVTMWRLFSTAFFLILFLDYITYIYFVFMCVLSAHTPVYHMDVWYQWRSEEGIVSCKTGDVCGTPYGCWEWNLDPLQRQSVLLTADSSQQP